MWDYVFTFLLWSMFFKATSQGNKEMTENKE